MADKMYTYGAAGLIISAIVQVLFGFFILQIVLIAAGSLAVLTGAIFLAYTSARAWQDIRRGNAEIALMEKEANIFSKASGSNIVIATRDDRWKVQGFEGKGTGTYLNQPDIKSEFPIIGMGGDVRPDLISVIKNSPQLWIIGGQKSGKTTLMNHLVDALSVKENHIIIDSHDHVGKWPEDAHIIGGRRDYSAIGAGMDSIIDEVNRRYEIYYQNPAYFDACIRDRVIADEWTLIPEKCPVQTKRFIDSYFTEGRKVNFDFCMATHSDRVEKIGFKNKKDIWERIESRVYLCNDNGDRYAYLLKPGQTEKEAARDGIKYALPGPYGDRAGMFDQFDGPCQTTQTPQPERREPEPEIYPGEIEYQLNGEEQKVLTYLAKLKKVKRSKLLASKCLGRNANAAAYNAVISGLESKGRVTIKTTKLLKNTVYRLA